MLSDYKTWLGLIAVALTFSAYAPYLRGIYAGDVKPHIFSWLVWSIVTVIAVIIQVAKGAGAGAWPIMIAGALCLWITALSVTRGSKDIRKSDWFFLSMSLSAIPLWLFTDDPTGSALLVTAIEMLACFSTIRKSWHHPEQEHAAMYGINIIRYILTLFAITHYAIATTAFPVGILIMNVVIFLVLIIRRRVMQLAKANML